MGDVYYLYSSVYFKKECCEEVSTVSKTIPGYMIVHTTNKHEINLVFFNFYIFLPAAALL